MLLPLHGALSPLGVAQQGKAASSLLTGLVHFWTMSESSGVRSDSVGTNHLADPTSIGSAPGLMGNAASLVKASSQYFSGTTPTVFSSGAARTLMLWFKIAAGETVPNSIFGVQNLPHGSDRRCSIYSSGSAPYKTIGLQLGSNALTTAGFYSTEEWHQLIYTFDGVDTHNLYSDGGTLRGTKVAADAGSTAGMYFGNSAAGYLNGLLQQVGVWSRVLSTDEMATIYAAGAGLPYPF